MPTQQEIQTVKETGICCSIPLSWERFSDGTGVAIPIPKAKSVCSSCLTQYIKSLEVVDLDLV